MHIHTQRHATERINTNTPRLKSHTIPNPQPTHQLHPKNYHTPPPTTIGTHHRKYKLTICIVANSKALTLLEPHSIQPTMKTALPHAYGHTVQTIPIDTTTLESTNIDIITSYKDIPILIQTHQTTTILYTKPHKKMEPQRLCLHRRLTCKRQQHSGSRSGKSANTDRRTYRHQITERKTYHQHNKVGSHHSGP